MGQYYTPVLLTADNKIKNFETHHYENGAKLMEHSYIGNNLVAAVLDQLVSAPHQVLWLGDYAEMEDLSFKYEDISSDWMKEMYSSISNIQPDHENQKWRYNNAYVINYDKNCYLRLEENDPERYQVCPLCLLTAVGNGRGGGDYFGTHKNLVGIWAGDRISVEFEFPEECADMTDITALYGNSDFWKEDI